jgi:hypothetical protein
LLSHYWLFRRGSKDGRGGCHDIEGEEEEGFKLSRKQIPGPEEEKTKGRCMYHKEKGGEADGRF